MSYLQYDVVYKPDIQDLINKVNDLATRGWKPKGGICSCIEVTGNERHGTGPQEWFYQAVVRKVKE